MSFSIITLSITMICHYAEYRILFSIMLSVIVLNVVMLSVIVLNVVLLIVIMLSVMALTQILLVQQCFIQCQQTVTRPNGF